MSIHVVSWVLKHSTATKSRRLVLIALADKANEDGTGAYPSIETLRQEARLESKSTVYDALAELEDQGHIRRNGKGPNGTTRWQVVMGNGDAFYHRNGSDEASAGGGPKIGKGVRAAGPEPSLRTVPQQEISRTDGSVDGSGPEIGKPLAAEDWQAIRDRLTDALSEFNFYVYIEPLKPLGRDGSRLVVAAPPHIASTMRARFSTKLTAAAREVLGAAATVDVVVGETATTKGVS